MEMRVEPSELTDVISVTPAISPRRRSSGAATVAAMVSGSAPGRLALTLMVGNSTDGQAGHRQEAIGDQPQQEQADRQQRGADRPLDEGPREVHGATPPAGGRAAAAGPSIDAIASPAPSRARTRSMAR